MQILYKYDYMDFTTGNKGVMVLPGGDLDKKFVYFGDNIFRGVIPGEKGEHVFQVRSGPVEVKIEDRDLIRILQNTLMYLYYRDETHEAVKKELEDTVSLLIAKREIDTVWEHAIHLLFNWDTGERVVDKKFVDNMTGMTGMTMQIGKPFDGQVHGGIPGVTNGKQRTERYPDENVKK